jgi:hypothetical protein
MEDLWWIPWKRGGIRHSTGRPESSAAEYPNIASDWRLTNSMAPVSSIATTDSDMESSTARSKDSDLLWSDSPEGMDTLSDPPSVYRFQSTKGPSNTHRKRYCAVRAMEPSEIPSSTSVVRRIFC